MVDQGVDISWHGQAGAIGYDYGRGKRRLARFNILGAAIEDGGKVDVGSP